jgi:hypothetical protein
MFWSKARSMTASATGLTCSFCGKPQDEVDKLIAGPSVWICDGCVDVCNDILVEDARLVAHAAATGETADAGQAALTTAPATPPAIRCALCHLPTLVEDGVAIPNRGLLCPGCVSEIEATLAERRIGDP